MRDFFESRIAISPQAASHNNRGSLRAALAVESELGLIAGCRAHADDSKLSNLGEPIRRIVPRAVTAIARGEACAE